jgi:glycosyltransferase involved in cell wall biosynthesis
VRHQQNTGVAAAILNGIRHAGTEVVCSIDCDCTYDPHDLRNMIPLLAEDVSLVTASPYHPQGHVRNVPRWRLSLSRGASVLYRQVLRQKLFTYTSCFRVYRRSAVVDLRLRERGFLGIAEILGRLDLRGAKVIEHPATLEVRLFGRSKMKVVKTIGGHLRLLTRLLLMRLQRNGNNSRQSYTEIERPSDVALNVNYKSPSVNPQK